MPVANYIWDPVDDNVIMETDENGATTATYTHEPGQYGGLISQRRCTTDSYYQSYCQLLCSAKLFKRRIPA